MSGRRLIRKCARYRLDFVLSSRHDTKLDSVLGSVLCIPETARSVVELVSSLMYGISIPG